MSDTNTGIYYGGREGEGGTGRTGRGDLCVGVGGVGGEVTGEG